MYNFNELLQFLRFTYIKVKLHLFSTISMDFID